MAVVGELLILMGANNAPLMASLASSEAAVKGFSTTTSTHGASATAALGGVAVAGGALAAVIGGASLKAAADFQEQMAIINTIAHQTPDLLGETADSIRDMAAETGSSLPDMTQGFYDLLSAGVSIGNAMEFLRNSTTLSIGGLSTVAESVDLLTTTTNAWGSATGRAHVSQTESARAMDVWAKAIERGKVTAADIAGSLSNVASTAAALNIPIEEVAATYSVLTARGVPAAEATTRLNAALISLQKIPPGMQELQDKTHKSYEAIAKTQGVQAAMQAVVTDAERYKISLIDVFGRQEAMAFALQVTGKAGQQFSADLKAMYDSTGTAAGQADERMGTFNRQLDILGASAGGALISVGTAGLPMITALAEAASGAAQAFTAWSDLNPGLAATILAVVVGVSALVLGALALGPILGAIGAVIGIITSPLLLIGGAILALAAHFGLLGEGARGMVDGVLAQVAAMVPVVIAKVQELGRAFIAWIGPLIGPALSALAQFAGQMLAWVSAQVPVWVGQIGKWAAAFIDWIAPMIGPALAALGKFAAAGIAWVVAQLPKWTAALLKWVEAFLAWLAPMIPPLIVELGKFAAALIGWIAQQVPVIALAVLKLGQQLVAWVDNAIPGIVAALARFLNQVLAWFQSIAPVIAKAASDLGASIAHNLIAGIGDIGKAVGDKLNTIPGLSLVGGAVGGVVGAAQGIAGGKLPQFAQGGTVPGSGPQLAVVHGGEHITPAGQAGGGQTQLTHTTVVQLDGQTIGQVIERLLFNGASGASSGFAGSSVTD